MTGKEVLNKIIPNIEIDIPLSKHYFDELSVMKKKKGNGILKVGIVKNVNFWLTMKRQIKKHPKKS